MPIPESEQRKLFARSGNRCAIRDCRRPLVAEGSPPDRLVVLGEMAHIVAERVQGPRGNSSLSLEERNRYENLILLCNNHHQLVDSQPETFTVDRLLAIKVAHEEWVEKTLGPLTGDGMGAMPQPRVTEVVHSTLLPVIRMPAYVYGARYEHDEQSVQKRLGAPRNGEMLPYIVRGKMLYAFQDLRARGNPFDAIVTEQPSERFHSREWWDDPDRLAWFLQLLNRALNKLTGRRRLWLDKEHRRYYFAPSQPGVPLSVRYRPLNQKRASRQVVWQPRRKATGLARPYWYHRAVALSFIRTSERNWGLRIRPELRVTIDGLTTLPPATIGSKVTRKKARMFNYDLLGEIQFWRDYLSDSKPRMVLPFGSRRQTLVISTTLMHGEVTWPGIPAEHAKPFKNVEYLDDLFTWAELQTVDASLADDDEDDEWLEDEMIDQEGTGPTDDAQD